VLSRIDVQHVRNLQKLKLDRLQQVNVFFGNNGSGKTSILESVHLLGMARSFRGKGIRSLVTHGESACTVFGLVSTASAGGRNVSIGVERKLGESAHIKIAGQSVASVAELVETLPLQVINAQSFDLLTGAPASRRQYLDWGVFHVEHRFLGEWQRFQRHIKQRNSLLRHDKMGAAELAVWTNELAISGEAISAYRQNYFDALEPRFKNVAARLIPELPGLELRYRRGWDSTRPYKEALETSLGMDRQQGYTHVGPQRADLRVMIDGHLAAETLSRGQQKLVICALKLAQGQVMTDHVPRGCSYLVDDLPSELDSQHSRFVCNELAAMAAQVFITCVEAGEISSVWPNPSSGLAMFHVEHGVVVRR
jgi:DNA replication and repair protein RecF